MKRPIIYPYKMSSESARALKKALNTFMVYPNREYRYKPNDLIINWGNGSIPDWWSEEAEENCLNSPYNVRNSINKIKTFQELSQHGIPIPENTTDINTAKQYAMEGNIVFCRQLVSSRGGKGIILARNVEQVVHSTLYTKDIKSDREFRVHVFRDNILDIYEKTLRKIEEQDNRVDLLIKSHKNYYFALLRGRPVPDYVSSMAIEAIKVLGLDFGGVDVGLNTRENKAYVFEVNTACGIGPSTTQTYVRAISNVLTD